MVSDEAISVPSAPGSILNMFDVSVDDIAVLSVVDADI